MCESYSIHASWSWGLCERMRERDVKREKERESARKREKEKETLAISSAA